MQPPPWWHTIAYPYWLDVRHRLLASLALRAAMLGPRRVDSLGRRFINSVVHMWA